MDQQGFRQFLQKRELSPEVIEQHLSLVQRFEGFLEQRGLAQPLSGDDAQAFSALLLAEGLNTFENYLALLRYGAYVHNDQVYVAIMELLDGAEAMQGLYDKLALAVGEGQRDQVFEGIDLPSLGTPSSEKAQVTQAVMERLEELVDAQTCKKVLSGSLRNLQDEHYLEEREKYLACGGVDAYLEQKGRAFMAQLEQIRDEGGLFFTQKISDAALEFVRSHREISHGVREGNVIYEVKIPYMTTEYLAETDERMRRYYYCHCPWVRESLRADEASISPTFCNCSAGFHKKAWEVIFEQPLEARVVETVLQGDEWCKIAIYLPE